MKSPFDEDEDLLRPRLTSPPRVPALVRELAAGAALAVAAAGGCDSSAENARDGGGDTATVITPMPPMVAPMYNPPPMYGPPPPMPSYTPDAAVDGPPLIAPMEPPSPDA